MKYLVKITSSRNLGGITLEYPTVQEAMYFARLIAPKISHCDVEISRDDYLSKVSP